MQIIFCKLNIIYKKIHLANKYYGDVIVYKRNKYWKMTKVNPDA